MENPPEFSATKKGSTKPQKGTPRPPPPPIKKCPDPSVAVTPPPECSCFEDDTAYFGNNHLIGHENMKKSARECQLSCEETEECNYWTWGKGRPEGPCYLKTKRENVRGNLTSYVSGSKKCKESLPGPDGTKEDDGQTAGGRGSSASLFPNSCWPVERITSLSLPPLLPVSGMKGFCSGFLKMRSLLKCILHREGN